MRVVSTLSNRPALPLSLAGIAVGLAITGLEGAVLGAFVGFFLGKSLRSILRTFAAGAE